MFTKIKKIFAITELDPFQYHWCPVCIAKTKHRIGSRIYDLAVCMECGVMRDVHQMLVVDILKGSKSG